ncbi:hypothetical protein SEA_STEPHIG9_57 [Mycobacterium phage Stephig9]|uniref:Uncharacterized protein n=1 Tax=Mycobacterium phage Stephig9 TaxID=2591224 RepID=A0A514DHA9_9CAUD|nr:hypothetical protein SEA_STEPHIG9_57 [Mycobacterium phage Stephig9]
MSTKQRRKIGEIVTTTEIVVVEDEAIEEFRLLVGGRVIATAVDEGEDDGRWNVNVRDDQYRTNSFYVTDSDEAVDALEDIGVLYLAAKNGEL